jgi:hypothetical protein
MTQRAFAATWCCTLAAHTRHDCALKDPPRVATAGPSTANKMSRLTSSVCYTRSNVIKRPLMVQAVRQWWRGRHGRHTRARERTACPVLLLVLQQPPDARVHVFR